MHQGLPRGTRPNHRGTRRMTRLASFGHQPRHHSPARRRRDLGRVGHRRRHRARHPARAPRRDLHRPARPPAAGGGRPADGRDRDAHGVRPRADGRPRPTCRQVARLRFPNSATVPAGSRSSSTWAGCRRGIVLQDRCHHRRPRRRCRFAPSSATTTRWTTCTSASSGGLPPRPTGPMAGAAGRHDLDLATTSGSPTTPCRSRTRVIYHGDRHLRRQRRGQPRGRRGPSVLPGACLRCERDRSSRR